MTNAQFLMIILSCFGITGVTWYFKNKCSHVYRVIEKKTIVDNSNFPIGTKIISRCEKCGKIKMDEF